MPNTTMDTLRERVKELEYVQSVMDKKVEINEIGDREYLRAVSCKLDFIKESIKEYVYDHGK
jgi:hypothetical protein